MDVTFLTPVAGLVALLVVLPLAALALTERRVASVRNALRLPVPRASRPIPAIALVVLAGLLGLGAAQPTVTTTKDRLARTDAEIYVVFDTSRSMLAASSASGPTRFERARAAAHRIRNELTDVPVGLASVTDRALPHLLPTVNRAVFRATVDRTMDVNRPPPLRRDNRVASTFDALRNVPTGGFFSPEATKRLVIYLTDAETRVYDPLQMRNAFQTGRARLHIVRFWREGERVFRRDGSPEPQYQADPRSASEAQTLAETGRGQAFDEDEVDEAIAAAIAFVGKGEAKPLGEDPSRTSLAPYLFLVAFVPLGFLVWRRNF